MPLPIKPSIQVNTEGVLTNAERARQRGSIFGEASPLPAVPMPASQGVTTNLSSYVPQLDTPIPSPEGKGLIGVVNSPPITAETTPEELAASSRSALGARQRFQPSLDEEGNAIWNPQTEQYDAEPIPMQQYAEQQQAELETKANMAPVMQEESYVDQANRIMGIRNEVSAELPAGPKKDYLQGNIPEKQISKWSDEAATSLANVASRSIANLFDPDSAYVTSMDPDYMGVAAGLAIADKYNIPDNIMASLPLIVGIANAGAVEQANTFQNRNNQDKDPQDYSGNTIAGTMSKENLVNSMMHSMNNAFERMGVAIDPEATRKLSEATILAEIDKGDSYRPYKNKEGKWVYAATPETKATARNLSRVIGALSGDNKRMLSSTTPQIAGGMLSKPGSQLTTKSIPIRGATYPAAEATKDIMGSIAEQFEPKAILQRELEVADIIKNFNKENGYSTSIFAANHKVDRASFNKLKRNVSPDRNFNPKNQEEQQKFEDRKEAHARDEIDNQLSLIQYDIDNAKAQGGLRYTAYSHSTANQRMFRLNAGTDILASKNGIRQMLGFGIKSHAKGFDLFGGEAGINPIKEIARRIFKLKGEDRHKALMALSPTIRAALGLMESAVREYHTFSGDPNVTKPGMAKVSELDAINAYTPAIAKHLAMLGKEYNAWLENPEDSNSSIAQLLSRMPRGEAQGHMSLWDDMFQLQNAFDNKQNQKAVRLTSLNYDDGNQNGIFLQALYAAAQAAGADPLSRLGTFNPNLKDMRGFAMNQITSSLKEILGEDIEAYEAWSQFFDEAYDANPDKMASDLFKAPLMQHSYGKHGSMFFEHILDMLEDDKYSGFVDKHLIGSTLYATPAEAANNLSFAMEHTLSKVIDPTLIRMLKNIGRGFAILNETPAHKGLTGDTWYYSSTDVGFVPNANKPKEEAITNLTDSGTEYLTQARNYESTTYGLPNTREASVNKAVRQNNPSATKGTQFFWNRRTKEFDTFENPLGSSLSRLMGVMPIQSTDGDLLKIMTLYVNADQKIPLPVATVHDSLITTMDTMHIYRNAYNNVAIPRAVPEIAKFASRLNKSYEDARQRVFDSVEDQIVGIGSNGEYASMGAFFDEIDNKLKDPVYKARYIDRYGGLAGWEKKVAKDTAVLSSATKSGWVNGVANLAVKGNNFKELFKLAENHLKLNGPKNELASWVNDFPSSVQGNYDTLRQHTDVKKHGIAQMSYAGSGIATGHFTPGINVETADEKYVSNYNKAFSSEE